MPSAFVSVRLSETISSNHRKTVLVVAQNYRKQSEFIGTNRKSIGERQEPLLDPGERIGGACRWVERCLAMTAPHLHESSWERQEPLLVPGERIGGACRWVGRCLTMTAPHLHESSWGASRAATWFGVGIQRGAAVGSVGASGGATRSR